MDKSTDQDLLEVERLRLEWLAMAGPSRAAQRAANTQAEIWWAWARWQAAKARLESRSAGSSGDDGGREPAHRSYLAVPHHRGPMDLSGPRKPASGA
jgi:hypothetical protein